MFEFQLHVDLSGYTILARFNLIVMDHFEVNLDRLHQLTIQPA